jgi:predicted MFS family arabinose efflux permease
MSLYPTTARSKIRRLAAGRLISATGGAAAYTALNFTVWERTHSPGMQALSLLLTFGVAGLMGPFAGALGDRYDRRKVMIWCEAGSAMCFVVMAFLHAPLWLIAFAFASALTELPFFTASRAAIPNLVDSPDDVSWANSLVSTSVYGGIALGPLIGGVVVAATGASWVFALNAVTFFVSIALTLTVRGDYQQLHDGEAHDEHRGIAAGATFLWRDRVLRRMTIAWFVFVLGMGISMVADAALAERFGTRAIGFAALIACWGTGSVIGSTLGRFLKPATEPVWLVIASFGIGLAALGVGYAPMFVLVLCSLLVMGASDGLTMVAETGIMQRRTPDAVRSRAMAAFEGAVSLGLACAYLMAAPVLRWVGPQVTYRIGGVSALAAAVLLLPLLRLRSRGSTPEPAIAAAPPRYASAEALEASSVRDRHPV